MIRFLTTLLLTQSASVRLNTLSVAMTLRYQTLNLLQSRGVGTILTLRGEHFMRVGLCIVASHSTRKSLPSCLWHKQALSSLIGRIGLCVCWLLKFSVAVCKILLVKKLESMLFCVLQESACKDAPCIAPTMVTKDFCCFSGLISSHRPYTKF